VFAHEVVDVLANTSLTSLDISDNYISDYGMRLILQRAIRSESLKNLMVKGNHMGRHTIKEFRRIKRKGRISMNIPKTRCLCGVCMYL
jgi:hypothetical protein